MPFFYGTDIYYWIVLIPAMLLAGIAQIRVSTTFNRWSKVASSRDLQYDKTKNPRAGPFWDRRLTAAEGRQMAAELQDYVRRRARP